MTRRMDGAYRPGTDAVHRPKVAIIGGGPAGLSAAKVLGERYGGDILLIERESALGGIPRHSDHPGYGIRDRKQGISGPSYARKLSAEAREAGVEVWLNAQVTGWEGPRTLQVTSPRGRVLVEAEVILLATGARERPRTARMIWGDRPGGVYTTGQLQNAVHLYHQDIGSNAVVVGAELVSWSAVMTLREAGCRTSALISRYPQGEAYKLFTVLGSLLFRTKVVTNSRVVAIHGRPRVESIEIEDVNTGRRSTIACDTVIFTGDWIPDYELAWAAGLERDGQTGAPVVDNTLMTSQEGVFSVGNLNHPVETADVVAIEGQFVGRQIIAYLESGVAEGPGLQLEAGEGIDWLSPQVWRPGGPQPPRKRIVSWVDALVKRPVVEARQDGRIVGSMRLVWPAAPGRVFRIPTNLLRDVDPSGGKVTISVR
ncbi:FAD-dependent oxidoreductase [Actinomycetaceae bacterium L2_0104]